MSGGKTVSCDQVAFGKNVFVNIALRELELSSQTPCWLESKQEFLPLKSTDLNLGEFKTQKF